MEDNSKAILHSYRMDGSGTATIVDPAQAFAATPGGGFCWIHLNGRHPDTKKILKDTLHLDALVIRTLLAEETRPRLEIFEDHALIILRGIHYNPGAAPEDLVSLRLWVNGSRIVSIGRRKARAIAELDERIHQNRGPRRTGEFVALLVGLLNDGIEPAIRELEDLTDDIEDRSLDLVAAPGAAMRNEIALVRKQSILFRRHISPQRDALSRLQNARLPWMKEEDDKWQMQDNLDRAARYIEDLDTIRERTQIVQDEVASSMTARLNKNIYILSMITVIFMPLTFLTGLLGINVQGIPGAHSALAFLIVCLLLAGMAIGEVLLFRRLKWL